MTTPVGSIEFRLGIDGSRLPREVLDTIHAAIKPTLREVGKLNRELDALQRNYGQVGRDAQTSGVKQAAAANTAERAVKNLGDEHTKSGAKASAASGVSTRSLNAQTRALERQAVAWTKLAAAQSAAAAAPQPSGPPRGGSGGGGGGGGGFGGGRGGRFTSGFTGAGVFGGGALALGSFPAAATVVTNLTGAVQQLVQTGLLVPGVIAGIASSVGTAAIGFQGMGDAVKALNEAAASGDPKDLEKAAEALKHMDVNAVNTAKAVSAFTQGPWKDLQKQTAHNMFEGVDQTVTQLAEKTMPTLSRGTAQVGSAWNKTFKELGRVGGLDSTTGFLDKIFGNTAEAQTRANNAIAPLIHGMGTLTSEGTDFLPRLADGLTAVTTRFDNWITRSAQNGNLDKWINQGIEGVGNLGETLLNIGKIITDITKAAGGDGGLLQWLEKGSTALAKFTGSAEGQEKLSAFFAEGRAQIQLWIPVLQQLWQLFMQVYEASKQWAAILLPALSTTLSAVNALPGGLQALFLGLVAFKTLSPFVGLIGGLSQVDGLLGGINGKAGGLRGALKNVGLIGGAGLAISGMAQPGFSLGGAAQTIGGGALAGASVGGVPGAIIGGVTGAVISLAERIKSDLDQGKAEWEQRWEADRQREPGSPGTPEGQLAAVPALRGVRSPSLYNADGTLKPSIGDDISAKIGSGQLPGWQVRPDGSVVGPNGAVLPGITAPAAATPGPRTYGPPLPPPGNLLQSGAPAGPDLSGTAIGAKNAFDNVQLLANAIETLPTGEVVLKENTPEAIKKVKDLGYTITNLPTGQVAIAVQYTYNGSPISLEQLRAPIRVAATPGGSLDPRGGGRADGGVLPGYSPGVDNMLVPLSGGEGILIPEAVRGLGGSAGIYAINSRFRGGLSKRGYADGGVVAGMSPMAADIAAAMAPVVGLLSQILAQLGGQVSNDLASQIGDSTATALTGATGPAGVGGTGQRGWLPGDPLEGWDLRPWWTKPQQMTAAAGTAGLPGLPGTAGITDLSRYASGLSGFARSGTVSDVTGLGLDANDPVVKAIVAARNKKKNALGDDAIASLIDEVLVGGGFTGTLDSGNTSLVTALQSYREKLAKSAAPGARGSATLATSLPMTQLPTGALDPLSAFAQRASGGQYEWGASDLAAGLSDCSGAVSDLVEIITKGQADSGRLFSTASAADVLTKLGATPGLSPGALQIGFNSGHMAATLPNGVNFESGGGTGQGATYGGNAVGAGDPRFTQQFSLPVGALGFGTTPGLQDPMQSMASNMCGCVGDSIGGMSLLGGGAPGQQSPEMQALSQALTSSINAVLPKVLNDTLAAAAGAGDRELPDKTVSALDLIKERNPAAVGAALGYKVGDYNRTGGQGQADNVMQNASATDLRGAIYSDTAALLDRTLTSIETANDARQQQLLDIMTQVRDQLVEISAKLSQAAIESASSSAGSALGGLGGLAAGGPVVGPGSGTSDSIIARLSNGEYVVPAADVARAGGFRGIDAWRRNLPGFATGGGVIANDTVGAEFFGVSQIPIIGLIVNIIVRVLLAVLGVQIEARDTLNEITDEFRDFRGDFKSFDAAGRLLNDTSALVDRSQTSEETAAEERIRILKIVIQALIKYIIENVIVPLAKAVANSLLQAAGSAASTAISGFTGGAGAAGGAAASSLITGVGGAGVDVFSQIFSDIGVNLFDTLIDVLGDGLMSEMPGLMTGLFGGGMLESLIAAPLQMLFSPLEVLFGSLPGIVGGIFSPILGLLGGLASFDDGGIAHGMGFMPKAVIAPERVLSPSNTVSFDRLPDKLDRLVRTLQETGRGGSDGAYIDAKIIVEGGPQAGEQIRESLMELMRG